MSNATPPGARGECAARRGAGSGERGASSVVPRGHHLLDAERDRDDGVPRVRSRPEKLENNARRAGKPGTAPIMRAFSFLVRVVLATVLLPLDLLMGDAVRAGDMTRPLTGAFGVVVAYGAFRAAEVAVGIGRASSSDDVETISAARFRVRPPAALDPCRLRGVPFLSRSSACAYTGAVARVVVEPFEVTGGSEVRASGASTADIVDLETRLARRARCAWTARSAPPSRYDVKTLKTQQTLQTSRPSRTPRRLSRRRFCGGSPSSRTARRTSACCSSEAEGERRDVRSRSSARASRAPEPDTGAPRGARARAT